MILPCGHPAFWGVPCNWSVCGLGNPSLAPGLHHAHDVNNAIAMQVVYNRSLHRIEGRHTPEYVEQKFHDTISRVVQELKTSTFLPGPKWDRH